MTRTVPRLVVMLGAIGSATCCPSLFLTVTKGDPSPLTGLPAPKAAAVPLLVPANIENRFEVLSRTAQPSDYADFEDVVAGPRGATSLRALERIKQQFGVPSAPDLVTVIGSASACVVCAGPKCNGLLFPKTPFAIEDGAVVTLREPHAQARTIALAEGFTETTAMFAGCNPHAGDTVAMLDDPLEGVTAFEPVTVTLTSHGTATVTGFVHISDVQIRDPDIRVGDRVLSRHLDKLISSFEYDRDLEVYNRYVVDALFATINQMHKVMPEIGFVIHTGDAIDSGVTTELREFHQLYDALDIPSYDVLGNHDVLIFGNMLTTTTRRDDSCITASSEALSGSAAVAPFTGLIPGKICVRADISCPSCLPGEAKFVAGPSHEASHLGFMGEFKRHSPTDALAEPLEAEEPANERVYCPAISENGQAIEREIRIQATTRQHGFDLNSIGDTGRPPGYYAFANDIHVAGERRHALHIVLDTNDLEADEGGKTGRINTRQLQWLKATLGCVAKSHPKDLVFVFGHHGLKDTHSPEGDKEPLESVLAASPNVVGYFYGHEHAHGICRRPGACQHFWEVMTGSVIEFPQEGRLVRVKEAGKGLAFLEVVTFGERLENGDDELGKAVELAHRGARHDYCANHDVAMCSDDLRPYRDDARHTSARLFFRLP